ncbi:MAG: hypothetical protein QW336_02505 [Candidatus Anstonellales archaeon]
MKELYIIILLLIILLVVSFYIISQKDTEIKTLEQNISNLEQLNEFLQSENDRLARQLTTISNLLGEKNSIISSMNLEIEKMNNTIDTLNKSLREQIDKYVELELKYNSTKATTNNLLILNNLVSEIEYRLNWLDLNYLGISDRYLNLKQEIVEYCYNSSILDFPCSYIVMSNYMNETQMNITDIHTALRIGKGDCVVYSIMFDRLLKEIRPIKIRMLMKSEGNDYSITIKNVRYNIKNYAPVDISYNQSIVVCYGTGGKGHCSLALDEDIIDYSMGLYLGKIGKNFDICQTDLCKWKTGWITLQILNNDIIYLNHSLRNILLSIR